MSSNRLILIFLGIIFLIILILGSNRIANSLRQRFAGVLPQVNKVTTTPTPTYRVEKPSPTPSRGNTAGNNNKGGPTAGEIPATGPSEIAWLILGGSAFLGYSLKKITSLKD